MSSATARLRRNLGLTRKLLDELKRWCVPDEVKPVQAKQAKQFTPKICAQLGVCVCGAYSDNMFFFLKLKQWMSHVFWKKRKTKEKSFERKLLEEGLVILQLSPVPVATESTTVGTDDLPAIDLPAESLPVLQQPVFLHVGETNFSTWHFGVMLLDMVEQSVGSNASLLAPTLTLTPAQPSEDSNRDAHPRLGIYSDMEAFKELLDLNFSWCVSVLTISFVEADWPLPLIIQDPTIPVRKRDEVTEFVLWHGSSQEAKARKLAAEAAQARRKRKLTPKQSGQKNKNAKIDLDKQSLQLLTAKTLRQPQTIRISQTMRLKFWTSIQMPSAPLMLRMMLQLTMEMKTRMLRLLSNFQQQKRHWIWRWRQWRHWNLRQLVLMKHHQSLTMRHPVKQAPIQTV